MMDRVVKRIAELKKGNATNTDDDTTQRTEKVRQFFLHSLNRDCANSHVSVMASRSMHNNQRYSLEEDDLRTKGVCFTAQSVKI